MDKSLQNKPGTQGQILHDSNYMSSLSSVQFSSLAQSCPTFCNPMDCSMPGFPVLHCLLEVAQTHVHWIWCHSTISSSVARFSSCLQSFSASGSFPMSWLFASGGQIIEASASVLLMNIQGWFPLGLTCLITLQSKGRLMSLLQHHSLNASILQHSVFFMGQFSHPYMTPRKTITLTIGTFVSKVMYLPFNTLSSFVIAFLPRSKCLLISLKASFQIKSIF